MNIELCPTCHRRHADDPHSCIKELVSTIVDLEVEIKLLKWDRDQWRKTADNLKGAKNQTEEAILMAKQNAPLSYWRSRCLAAEASISIHIDTKALLEIIDIGFKGAEAKARVKDLRYCLEQIERYMYCTTNGSPEKNVVWNLCIEALKEKS